MTKTELRKHLKAMDKDSLEEFVMASYDQKSKPEKELFCLNVEQWERKGSLLEKGAVIPDLKRIEKDLAFVDTKLFQTWRRLTPLTKKSVKTRYKTAIDELMHTPLQAACWPEAFRLLETCFKMAIDIENRPYLEYLNLSPAYFNSTLTMGIHILEKLLGAGFKRDSLESAIQFTCLKCRFPLDRQQRLLDAFALRLRNGDLRAEVLDQIEEYLSRPDLKDWRKENLCLLAIDIYELEQDPDQGRRFACAHLTDQSLKDVWTAYEQGRQAKWKEAEENG